MSDITFRYGDFRYKVNATALDTNAILLPDKRVLIIDKWPKTDHTQPKILHELHHGYMDRIHSEISQIMDAPLAVRIDGLDYETDMIPAGYYCSHCLVTGVKLWRQTFVSNPKLFCAKCAAADQVVDIRGIRGDGRYLTEYGPASKIGNYVPAIPTENGLEYWATGHVPSLADNWWRRLPTLKQ